MYIYDPFVQMVPKWYQIYNKSISFVRIFVQNGTRMDTRMTRYGTFYFLWVPLGIRRGLWKDFGRFTIYFGPLLGPLGRPFWELLGTLGQFWDLQTSKMKGFSRSRFWIEFGLQTGPCTLPRKSLNFVKNLPKIIKKTTNMGPFW